MPFVIFCIYICDVNSERSPSQCSTTVSGILHGNVATKFEDCTAVRSLVMAHSLSCHQHLLDICESELQYLDMSINVNKSVCTRVDPPHAQPCRNLFTSDAREIVWRESVRYRCLPCFFKVT